MNEEMRKEFERKMSELGFGEYNKHDFDVDEETGDYFDQDLNAMKVGFLIGWQASREAMKPIKLPEATRASTFFGGRTQTSMYIKECEVISAIESAGHKVAP